MYMRHLLHKMFYGFGICIYVYNIYIAGRESGRARERERQSVKLAVVDLRDMVKRHALILVE